MRKRFTSAVREGMTVQDPISCGELIRCWSPPWWSDCRSKEWQPEHKTLPVTALLRTSSRQAPGCFHSHWAENQRGARGGLVAAATLQKESQQAGAGGTQWPARQWMCVTYPRVGIRHVQEESGWAASPGPRPTHAINKRERRKVMNLGEMPWFLTSEKKTSIKNSQTWDVGQRTLKTLMVPA